MRTLSLLLALSLAAPVPLVAQEKAAKPAPVAKAATGKDAKGSPEKPKEPYSAETFAGL